MMKCKVGADPELFLFDLDAGKLISAAGLFPGSKEETFKVDRGAIQVDGMAAEYNIDPATNAYEFIYNNLRVLQQLRDVIKENNPSLNFDFRFIPVADFGAEYISSQPEEARRLGCTPDYNAWLDGAENPTPDVDTPFRTASGHIHIGWGEEFDILDPDHIEACCMMSKQLDCVVGIQIAGLDGKEGHRRRELYGKAGAFRPKSYGVEYRTPSNVWLSNTEYMRKLFATTCSSFQELIGEYRYYEQGEYNDIRKLIDSGDTRDIIRNYGSWDVKQQYSKEGEAVTADTLDGLVAKYSIKIGLNVPELIPVQVGPAVEQPWAELPNPWGAQAIFIDDVEDDEDDMFIPDDDEILDDLDDA